MPYPSNTITPGVPAMPIPPPGSRVFSQAPKYSQEELQQRSAAALEVVQREGLPDLVSRCRSGSDAEKEAAAALLSFIATHDQGCACMIVSAGALPPLIAMLGAESGRGDDDPALDMKEQACKTLRDLCIGDTANQRPIAERGAIPLLLEILDEQSHPWSIKEAAAEALALISYEAAGGPAQEILTASNGIYRLLNAYRSPNATRPLKESVGKCLRFMAVYTVAKQQMAHLGVLQPRETDPDSDGFEEMDALLMSARIP